MSRSEYIFQYCPKDPRRIVFTSECSGCDAMQHGCALREHGQECRARIKQEIAKNAEDMRKLI